MGHVSAFACGASKPCLPLAGRVTMIVCTCGSRRVKLMWDWTGSGLWCADCGRALDPSGLPVPDELAQRVRAWNDRCAALARQELAGHPAAAGWREAMEAEAAELRDALDRYVPAYLYRLVAAPPAGAPLRCPQCGRCLPVEGRAGGFAWAACEECLLWIAYPEGGREASSR